MEAVTTYHMAKTNKFNNMLAVTMDTNYCIIEYKQLHLCTYFSRKFRQYNSDAL